MSKFFQEYISHSPSALNMKKVSKVNLAVMMKCHVFN